MTRYKNIIKLYFRGTITEEEAALMIFAEKFTEIWDKLYEDGWTDPEAVTRGDAYIKANPDFVGKFCRYRGDIISSDREAAAFALTAEAWEQLFEDFKN